MDEGILVMGKNEQTPGLAKTGGLGEGRYQTQNAAKVWGSRYPPR